MIGHIRPGARAAQSLKIEIGHGGFVLDASAIAERFGLTEEAMRSLMSRRLMRGVVEKGEGADAGTWRLTMRYGNRMWRAILMANGELSEESAGFASTSNKGRSDHSP